MTDREFLEKAAWAASIPDPDGTDSDGTYWWYNSTMDGIGKKWNPLQDDGDAFRLMLACDITVFHDDGWVNDNAVNTSAKNIDIMGFDWDEDIFDTWAELVRFAIVRAAAAMTDNQ